MTAAAPLGPPPSAAGSAPNPIVNPTLAGGPPPASGGGASPVAWAILGAVVAAVAIGLVAAVLVRSNDDTTATADTATADTEAPATGDGATAVTSDDGAQTAQTRPRATAEATTTASPAAEIAFADRDAVLGRYVAVLWSGFAPDVSAPDTVANVNGQLAESRQRFGSSVIVIDSNQFRSLRDETVAVVFDGGFPSAVAAKQWCRDNGFPGTQDCFGVVLSDDVGPDDRGDFARVYDV